MLVRIEEALAGDYAIFPSGERRIVKIKNYIFQFVRRQTGYIGWRGNTKPNNSRLVCKTIADLRHAGVTHARRPAQ